MRGFILGAALVAAVVVLVAAGMNTTLPLPALKDLPLAHSFNARFPEVSNAKPLSFTLPPTTGFVLTYLKPGDYSANPWEIYVSGLCVRAGRPIDLGVGGWYYGSAPCAPASNPPVIVPPGGTLEIRPPASPTPFTCELGGYFISAEDLGR